MARAARTINFDDCSVTIPVWVVIDFRIRAHMDGYPEYFRFTPTNGASKTIIARTQDEANNLLDIAKISDESKDWRLVMIDKAGDLSDTLKTQIRWGVQDVAIGIPRRNGEPPDNGGVVGIEKAIERCSW